MTVLAVAEESQAQSGFYAPGFEVHIEGVGLPLDVLRDVISVTYKDDVTSIDSFELVVNNWDEERGQFKYTGSETQQDIDEPTEDSVRYKLFEPCQKAVTLRMGYADSMRVMLVGSFTTMEPTFPASGAPTLTVRGLNVLHQLRRKPYTECWPDTFDSKIAKGIAGKVDRTTGKRRFPLPIDIDPNALAHEPEIELVSQKNQYDIDFLFQRARERGYVLFVQEEDAEVKGSKQRLYFGPSQSGGVPGLRDVTYELEWGRSLIDFKPTLTVANQVRSVTVNGWNRRAKQPISATVTLDDKELNRNRDLFRLLNACDAREEVVVDEPVFTRRQARQRAVAILFDRQKEMVKVTGTTVGLPDMRAGKRVRIKNLGARFSGEYFLTQTTHTIGDSGYTTKFEARREHVTGAAQS